MRTIEQLAEILKKHKLWLDGHAGGERANLSLADLSSADLSSANLSLANLRSADLRSANLSLADLSLADLRSANLRLADLRSANLSLADLRSANLRLADLRFVRDDLWAVLSASPAEVVGLRAAIADGRIDGTCYSGECCCLVGTLGKLRGGNESSIPGLVPSAGRAAEAWFTSISPGQLPADNNHVALTLEWVDDWLARIRAAIPAIGGAS